MPRRPISKVITGTAAGVIFLGGLLTGVPAVADPPPWAPAHGWRDKHDGNEDDGDRREERRQDHRYVGYGGYEWDNDYGVIEGSCNRAAVGAVVGATLGGLIGSQVGGDQNRAVAVVVGAVLGSLVGHQIGQDMDDADRGCLGHALELAHDGQSVHWLNEISGVNYIVTPVGPWSTGGASCRQFKVRASQAGRSSVSNGRACRSEDGVWRMR